MRQATAVTLEQFDQMERRADRALGAVLWAKHVKHIAEGMLLFSALNFLLNSLLSSLSSDKLEALTEEQAAELVKTLTELYDGLRVVLDHGTLCILKRNQVFASRIETLDAHAEDILDVIHDLRLSSNKDFRAIIADCVAGINAAQSVEPVGRM